MLVQRLDRWCAKETWSDRFCRSVTSPTWRQIAMAIRKLDRRFFFEVSLTLENNLQGETQGMLTIQGGTGKYSVRGILAGQRLTRSYFDPQKVGTGFAQIVIWEGTSGSYLEEEDLCDDVEQVLRMARYFAEQGTLLPDVKWRCV